MFSLSALLDKRQVLIAQLIVELLLLADFDQLLFEYLLQLEDDLFVLALNVHYLEVRLLEALAQDHILVLLPHQPPPTHQTAEQ